MHPFITADVFTETPFEGNPLAVFPDARGISDARMQQIAREFNLSETVFILPPENPANFRRLRIFNPRVEMDFAGHPTIGATHVLAVLGEIQRQGQESIVGLEERAGLISVSVRWDGDRPGRITLAAARPPAPVGPPLDRATLAELVSLSTSDLATADATTMSCGSPFVLLPVRDTGALARAEANLPAFTRVLTGHASEKVFVFAAGSYAPGSVIRARMFAPLSGIPEDPATGSASVALTGFLAAQNGMRDGTHEWEVLQGVEMGRPSRLFISAVVSGGAVQSATVGGHSVVIMRGELNSEDGRKGGENEK